jgi:hypothetical protein
VLLEGVIKFLNKGVNLLQSDVRLVELVVRARIGLNLTVSQ